MRSVRAQVFIGNIAGNLRRIRLRQGLTQQSLAEEADLDLSFVQRVERAAENLSIGSLVKLADALRISPAQLLRPARRPAVKRGRPPKSRGE